MGKIQAKRFSLDTLMDAIEDGTTGFCVACGAERDCVEPDAERYPCEECRKPFVYGAEQILLLGLVENDCKTH